MSYSQLVSYKADVKLLGGSLIAQKTFNKKLLDGLLNADPTV